MIQEPSYYAVIPSPVRYDKTLPAAAKLMYGEITALCTSKGYCWAGNLYFAELYDVSKDTVSVWINKLDKAGYVRIEIDKMAGNTRRIYLSDKNAIPIEKKQDSYREKSVELSRKTSKAIAKNREHSNTSNNTESITMKEKDKTVAIAPEPVELEPIPVEEKQKKEPQKVAPKSPLIFPVEWPPELVAYYQNEWLSFRQKKPGTPRLLPESIQAQIDKLSTLPLTQIRNCIENSLSNGYTGLIYDRFTSQPHAPANPNPARNSQTGGYAGNYPNGRSAGHSHAKRKGYISASDLSRDSESSRNPAPGGHGRTVVLDVE